MNLVILISMLQPNFVAGGVIAFQMILKNRGETKLTVENPVSVSTTQFVYQINGTGLLDWTSYRGPLAVGQAALAKNYIHLEPGEDWTGVINLADYRKFIDEGAYEARVQVEVEGKTVKSGSVPFRVNKRQVTGISVGTWEKSGNNLAMALWMHKPASGPVTLFQQQFRESTKHGETFQPALPIERAQTGKDASDPLTQLSAHDFGSDPFHWALWREGNELLASKLAILPPSRLKLPPGFDHTIGPALLDRSHSVDVVLSLRGSDGRERFAIARFEDPARNSDTHPRVIELPAPPVAPEAAAVTVDGDGRRHLFFASTKGAKPELFHLAWNASGVLGGYERVAIEGVAGARLLADAPAAATWQAGGPVRAGLILESADDRRHLWTAEAIFGNGKEPPRVSVAPFEMPVSAAGARIAFSGGNGVPRRAVAIWGEDGKVYALDNGKTRVARQSASPAAPRVLVVLTKGSYLLDSDASGIRLSKF